MFSVHVPHRDTWEPSRLVSDTAVAFCSHIEHDVTVIDLNLLHRAVGRARDVEDAIDMFEGGVDGKALNRGLSAIQKHTVRRCAGYTLLVIPLPSRLLEESVFIREQLKYAGKRAMMLVTSEVLCITSSSARCWIVVAVPRAPRQSM